MMPLWFVGIAIICPIETDYEAVSRCLTKRPFDEAHWPAQRLRPFLGVFSLNRPSQVSLPHKAVGAAECET